MSYNESTLHYFDGLRLLSGSSTYIEIPYRFGWIVPGGRLRPHAKKQHITALFVTEVEYNTRAKHCRLMMQATSLYLVLYALPLSLILAGCDAFDLTWKLRGLQGAPAARSQPIFVSNSTHAFVLGGQDKNEAEFSTMHGISEGEMNLVRDCHSYSVA